MTIRNITSNDYKEFIEMCVDFYNTPAAAHPVDKSHFEKTFNAALTNNGITCKIIEKDGQVAGYSLFFGFYSNELGKSGIMIDELFIKREFRSCGLGSAFISKIKEITSAGFVRLEVNPENPAAIKLYKSLGFTEIPYMGMVL